MGKLDINIGAFKPMPTGKKDEKGNEILDMSPEEAAKATRLKQARERMKTTDGNVIRGVFNEDSKGAEKPDYIAETKRMSNEIRGIIEDFENNKKLSTPETARENAEKKLSEIESNHPGDEYESLRNSIALARQLL